MFSATPVPWTAHVHVRLHPLVPHSSSSDRAGQDEYAKRVIEAVADAVQNCYPDGPNGLPLHLTNPEKSVFYGISRSQLNALPVPRQQELFATKVLIVQEDINFEPLSFDIPSMKLLGNIKTQRHFRGSNFSFPPASLLT